MPGSQSRPTEWYTLEPQQLDFAEIEFTSRCNLRCTYCAVSGANYVNRDLPESWFASILDQLRAMGASMVQLNGHGETTFLKNWMTAAGPFVAEFDCKLISNFGRVLSDEEIAFLARLKLIHISIDSADDELLKNIRRKVSTQTIIDNIRAIQRHAATSGGNMPRLAFISGIYDKNVFGLPGLARLAVGLDIKEFHFWGLWKHGDIEGATNVNALDELPVEDWPRAAQSIDEAFRVLREAGIFHHVAGDFLDLFLSQVGRSAA